MLRERTCALATGLAVAVCGSAPLVTGVAWLWVAPVVAIPAALAWALSVDG